ncbi:MAG: helix-turn-helix domain-containing protein, partial [Thermoplasmata archaeon]|nr:helix-turn-helix domain-containing protein [Thermoplasmata archaeon]
MKTPELLFELSHPTRLAILRLLDGQSERLTQVARNVKARSPETSRHLDRLVAAGLVEKRPSADYAATPYGHLVVRSLGAVSFLASHEAYFRTHDLAGLPDDLVARIGDLAPGENPGGTFNNLARDERIYREATARLAFLTTDLPDNVHEALAQKEGEGSRVQVIVGGEYRGPPPTEATRHLFRTVPTLPMAAAIS